MWAVQFARHSPRRSCLASDGLLGIPAIPKTHRMPVVPLVVTSPVLSNRSRILNAMTITVSVLGSGSRGNATFVKTDHVRLLIDVGISRKEMARRLESIGED